MGGVRIALAAGLALTAVALALTLSSAPVAPAPASHPPAVEAELASTQHSSSVCQAGETLPQGTTAIRVSLKALIGPRIEVEATAGGQVLTSGEHTPGWTSGSVTVPVKRVARTVAGVKVCFAFTLSDETVVMAGGRTRSSIAAVAGNGQVLPGRLIVEYMHPGHSSWWSLALATARHMGLGRAWAGTWVALLVLGLMVGVLSLTVWQLLGLASASRGRLPAAAWACMLVACLNAAAWSFITPPFQVTDETDHFAYVQQLATSGSPPTSGSEEYARAEQVALFDLDQYAVRLQPANHPIFAQAQQRQLQADLLRIEGLRQIPTGAAGVATGEPPLYYALQAIPYTIAGGTVLDRLALMRLLSALFAGITALFVFLFVREALPGVAWAWTVGALAVALAPLLGFMSGGVNPDALLFAVSAAQLYCLARAFRRGLTPRLALAIGAVAGIGFATKVNFVGLVPGVLLGLVILALREGGRSPWRRAATSLALAVAAIAAPVLAVVAVDLLSHRPAFGPALAAAGLSVGRHKTLLGEIGYVWQLYLPRLPGMVRDFHSGFAPRKIWFDGYVGLFGWLDTTFPAWVYTAALVPAALLAGFCLRTLVARRATLRRRASELAVYVTIAVGLLLLLGVRSYGSFPVFGDLYGEARYLLPLLPLLAAVLALAARGAGRRWGPVLGTSIVLLAFAHDVFGQLQTIARYYH